MERTLGLDLGTNSLGWAIVDKADDDRYSLVDCGTDIFQEGVARDKNNEKPATQDRTAARGLRRQYARRRDKKIRLLKILVENNLCPPLTAEEIDLWRKKKIYPLNPDFINWQRTDDAESKNPYHDRHECLTRRLDLSTEKDRYILGRAMYHLCQRRGFLSNRKDAKEDDQETGKVKKAISALTEAMEEAGCDYLGEYFYRLYGGTQKIRGKYTSRKEHYEKEFHEICRLQQLEENLVKQLYKALFYQRPLKSQKHLVGKCPFEPSKTRCLTSHPSFEEFRMLQFINNIKIKYADETDFRPLTGEEILKILPAFYHKSKKTFEFSDIIKLIVGRKSAKSHSDVDFNFDDSYTVSGSPVTAQLREIFGKDDWKRGIVDRYALRGTKTDNEVINDVWHALISFDDEERLTQWAKLNLGLDDDTALKFAKIKMPSDYASLSLNAIEKILPHLRRGLRYDEAVMLANLKAVVPAEFADDTEQIEEIERGVIDVVRSYRHDRERPSMTKKSAVIDYLLEACGGMEIKSDKLYHPSQIDKYQDAQPNADGLFQLGSPQLAALKNPMVMRSLHRLRALVNQLLKKGLIDNTTKINIEFARELNTANMRAAITRMQRENEKDREKYRKEILEECGVEPTEDDLLRYRLWVEQRKLCLYTGKTISITQIIGNNPAFDIEHTIPRSKGGDNSLMNKTLCERRYNRDVKGSRLPASLPDASDIMARIKEIGWLGKIESLKKQLYVAKSKSKKATTKEAKDRARQDFHVASMKLDYWRGKIRRFEMTEVPDGFSNRQGVDTGIIGRYARLFLKTVFKNTYTVKGETTAEFRKMWGLQDRDEAKRRDSHTHHCIDAITIACIDKRQYDLWAQHVNNSERYHLNIGPKPTFQKPWETFTQDVKALAETILVSHHSPDNLPKKAKRLLRRNDKVVTADDGSELYVQGDAVRGALHQETLYGAIMQNGETKYVFRKSLRTLEEKDIDKIVDPVVRQKVRDAVDEHGIKWINDVDNNHVYMNREKGVRILKVRLMTALTRPIALKRHRDISVQPHKQNVYVNNDSNYCMAIYEGTDSKGKPKRSFRLVNNLEAAKFFNNKTDDDFIVPRSDKDGYPLKHLLKRGKMVIFYEDSPSELIGASNTEISKRLYKVTGFSSFSQGNSSYGVISFIHHLEARQQSSLKLKKGVWHIGEEYRPAIGLLHGQFKALVEGYDFRLTVDGKIEFIKNLT